MKKIKACIQDSVKSLGLGILFSSLVGVLLFFVGFALNQFILLDGLEVAKNGLLMIVAIGFFLIAGMLMVKGKKAEESTGREEWKKHFHLMGYKAVMCMICMGVLIIASAVDYLIVWIR